MVTVFGEHNYCRAEDEYKSPFSLAQFLFERTFTFTIVQSFQTEIAIDGMQEGERTLERRRQGAREQLEQIPQIYLTQSHKRSPILIIPHAENFSFEMVQLLLPSLKMFSFPAQESTNKVKK